jgi:hypothetical protein
MIATLCCPGKFLTRSHGISAAKKSCRSCLLTGLFKLLAIFSQQSIDSFVSPFVMGCTTMTWCGRSKRQLNPIFPE